MQDLTKMFVEPNDVDEVVEWNLVVQVNFLGRVLQTPRVTKSNRQAKVRGDGVMVLVAEIEVVEPLW